MTGGGRIPARRFPIGFRVLNCIRTILITAVMGIASNVRSVEDMTKPLVIGYSSLTKGSVERWSRGR